MSDDTWKSRAACLGRVSGTYDPWSPPDSQFTPPSVASAVCERCPVKRQCLIAGLENNEWGVWGGLTRRQRIALKRPRNRVRCPICEAKLINGDDDRYEICVTCGISWQKHRPHQSTRKALLRAERQPAHRNVRPRLRLSAVVIGSEHEQ